MAGAKAGTKADAVSDELGKDGRPTGGGPAVGHVGPFPTDPEELTGILVDGVITAAIAGVGIIAGGFASRLGSKVSKAVSRLAKKVGKKVKVGLGKGSKRRRRKSDKEKQKQRACLRKCGCYKCKTPEQRKAIRKACRTKPRRCPAGNCFVGGTVVDGRWAVEGVPLGVLVRTWRPGEAGYAEGEPVEVTVREREVGLRAVGEAGDGPGAVDLLRDDGWLAEQGIRAVGDRVELDLPEVGLSGTFEVAELGPVCETTFVRRAGWGRVTGRFRYDRGVTFDLPVDGELAPIGVTGAHPVWSVDRRAWVAVTDLQPGERVQTDDGPRAVGKVLARGTEPVYTLEVEHDHCYRVGEQGILVHNASATSKGTGGQQQTGKKCPCPENFRRIRKPSDWELWLSAFTIHEQFPPGRERNMSVVATAVFTWPKNRACLRKAYAVSSNRTNPGVRAVAMVLGYDRIFGRRADRTHAEQFLLDYAEGPPRLLRLDIDTPIAPSRPPCDQAHNPNEGNEGCGARIFGLPGVRVVYLGGTPMLPIVRVRGQ